MSSTFRSFLFKDIIFKRIWSVWNRGCIFSSVVRRCRRERAMLEVLHCFRQAFFKPRRTLLMSVTAAFNSRNEETSDCKIGISDDELEGLLRELEVTKELVKTTLQCTRCGKRIVIEKRQNRVQYCDCKDGHSVAKSSDGWIPFMEADDVIIWRKEYKPGHGIYAYKVYGRYLEVNARDFAAVQLDGAYRRVWDAAVAALAVVERSAMGVQGQAVLHWEVLWPRLFANRDYVYIRRHKEFDALNERVVQAEKTTVAVPAPAHTHTEQSNVHAKAKRKSLEYYERKDERERCEIVNNKVYVIVSRSCEHPDVPETKHAIRVSEYWSHMVVKTINGADKPGMEFVLTYYDEPAAGGLPVGVAAWASGRAAPGYLARMRTAAAGYHRWAADTPPHGQEVPDFTPFDPHVVNQEKECASEQISEQDMESSKDGPEMENTERTRDQSTQTEEERENALDIAEEKNKQNNRDSENVTTEVTNNKEVVKCEAEIIESNEVIREMKSESAEEEENSNEKSEVKKDVPSDAEGEESNASWWRYLYPFYYFV